MLGECKCVGSGRPDMAAAGRIDRARKPVPAALPLQARELLLLPAILAGLAFAGSLGAQVAREADVSLLAPNAWVAEFGGRVDVIDDMVVWDGDMVLGTVADVESGWSGPKPAKPGAPPEPMRRDVAIFGRSSESVLWPDPVIPYEIEDGFSDDQRQWILTAIREWNERTVISLVPRTTQEEYVLFQPGTSCRANVGLLRRGMVTNIWLGGDCSVRSIVHEIGHAVGLGHEHQRLDRNAFLKVRFRPSPETASNHLISYANAVGIEGLFNVGPFDFRSVMNYERAVVPLFGGIASYDTIPPGIPLKNPRGPWLSEGDIDGVARLYGPAPSTAVIATNPPGLHVLVDGTPVTGPASFDWLPDSVHTIEAPVAQQGMVFARWNAGGARVRNVVASSNQTWFEANYMEPPADAPESSSEEDATRFRLWTYATGTGSIVVEPSSDDGYYDAGTRVALSAEPGDRGGRFRSWEGAATSYEPTTWIDMDGPKVVILHWEPPFSTYWKGPLESSPEALQVYWNGHSDLPSQIVRLSNRENRSWRYRVVSDQPWLSASPAQGSLESLGSAEIALRLLSEGLPPGRYAGRLQVLPFPEDGRERKVLELAGVPVELVVGDEPGAAKRLTVRLGQSGESVELVHLAARGFLHSSGRPLVDGNRVTALNGDTFALTMGPDGAVRATYVPQTQSLELAKGLEVPLTKDREGVRSDAWRVGTERLGSGQPLVRAGTEYHLEHVGGRWRLARYLIRSIVGNAELSDGTLAVNASLSGPSGVTVDADGNVYVAEASDHRVRKIEPSGVITTVAGSRARGYGGDGGPAVEARLSSPRRVAVDVLGNLYVAETWNDRVRKIDTSGTITTVAGAGARGAYPGDGGPATEALLGSPHGVAADAMGNLYVAEPWNHRVRKIDASGTITTLAGTGEDGYAGDGGPATEARLYSPRGVAADAAGNVYVADAWNHRVRKIDASGTITTVAGTGTWGYGGDGGPATEALLGSPTGMAADAMGNLYVAETGNHRVRKIDASGTITTLAGTGTRGYGGDGGPAVEARLSYPRGIAADAAGNVYVADTGNHRVRRIDASGTISTLAGREERDDGPDRADSVNLHSPRGAAFDPDGNLVFLDGSSLWQMDAVWGLVSRVATYEDWNYDPPLSVTADSSGNLYLLQPVPGGGIYNKQIRKIDASGTISTLAEFDSPQSVTADALGNVYIVDDGAVHKIDGSGTVTALTTFGGELYWAVTAVADPAGNVYVVERQRDHSRRLLKIDTAGAVTSLAGIETDLEALAADSSGNVYLRREIAGSQIWKFDSGDGEIELIAGTGEPGFEGDGSGAGNARLWVSGMAVDSSGNVWFTDHRNRRIRVLEPLRGGVVPDDAQRVTVPLRGQRASVRLGASGETAEVLHYAARGFLHSASGRPLADGNRVTALNGDTFALTMGPDGAVTATYVPHEETLVLDEGVEVRLTKDREGEGREKWRAGADRMRYGYAFARSGKEYFLEFVDGQWKKSTHVVRTVVGNSDVVDGISALEASLHGPRGVAADPVGNIYVADSGNSRVRRIDAAGTITTLAGTGEYGYSGDGGPAARAQLRRPEGVAADVVGNVYVADPSDHRVRRIDTTGTITTLAGTGVPGYGGDGGPATQARLNRAVDVAADAVGNVYVADAGNSRVRRIDTTGTITTLAGTGEYGYGGDGGPATQAQFRRPEGLAADALGNVYVADRSDYRVRRIDATGTITTLAGTGERGYSGDGGPATQADLQGPHSVAADAAGNLYIAVDYWVRKIDLAGTITTITGTLDVRSSGYDGDGGPATEARLFPDGMAVDAAGNVFVTDDNLNRVFKIDVSGTLHKFAGTGSWKDSNVEPILSSTSHKLLSPRSLGVAGSGEVFVVDGGRVWKLDTSGGVSAFAGTGQTGFTGNGGPATEADLYRPRSVAADAVGNLYIVEEFLVRKIDLAGTITIFAGNLDIGYGYGGDGGPATEAMFLQIRGLAADAAGNVYVADTGNHRVRKIDAAGTVTTVAGTGEEGHFGGSGPVRATEARLSRPFGVAADVAGNVYVLSTTSSPYHRWHVVSKIDPSGNISAIHDGLAGIRGIAAYDEANIYLGMEHQIVNLNSVNGETSLIAGTGKSGFRGEAGSALTAHISIAENGIAVDADGRVWFVDQDNRRIRVIEQVSDGN